jgi:hypothetical protein
VLTCGDPPGEMTHWTGRAMAKTVGLALHTVQRIWRVNRLQPHRLRTFERSTDPALAEKVEDIVGLYMHPPAHAVVLSALRCLSAAARAPDVHTEGGRAAAAMGNAALEDKIVQGAIVMVSTKTRVERLPDIIFQRRSPRTNWLR